MLDTTKMDALLQEAPTKKLCPLDLLDQELAARTVMGEAERTAIVLWCAHTYCFDKFKHTPRLFLTSGGPGCGKSETLRMIAAFAEGGKKFEAGTSYAAIRDFRRDPLMRAENVTCVVDQLDGIGKTSSDDFKLMNLLCSSTEIGAKIAIKEKEIKKTKETFKNVEIDVGYPMALAKIGNLPNAALASRCITVIMQPETPAERAAQIQARQAKLPELRTVIRDWAKSIKPKYIQAPKGTESRTEDMWQALLNVAAHAGGHWPERARKAIVEIHDDDGQEPSRDVTLLKSIFEKTRKWNSKEISGKEITTLLGADSGWSPIQRGLALKRVGVKVNRRSGSEKFYLLKAIDEQAKRRGIHA